MATARMSKLVWLAAACGFGSCAHADGLGGLDALGILAYLFVVMLLICFSIVPYGLRATARPDLAKLVARINMAASVLCIYWGSELVDRSLIQTLNPWWGSDSTVIALACLALAAVNLGYIFNSLRGRLGLAAAFLLALGFQFMGVPGRSFEFTNDPLPLANSSVRIVAPNHAFWGNRILYFPTKVACCRVFDRAVVTQDDTGRYRVDVVQLNKDPRMAQPREWTYRFPVQPRYVAESLIENAEILGPDWQVEKNALTKLADDRNTIVHPEWMYELVARGADPNFIDIGGSTPLLINMRNGGAMLESLVGAGADPNLRYPGGETALHILARERATRSDSANVAQMLIKLGANPRLRDRSGRTSDYYTQRCLRAGTMQEEAHRNCARLHKVIRS